MIDSAPPARSGVWTREPWRDALVVVGLITLARVVMLSLAHIDLSEDETQYWAWAQTPAFGYFSKPPMIAWLIWTTTHLFGDSAFGVRLAAPLLHGGTALLIFAIARRIYDPAIGFWSAVTYVTLPAVSLSSGLISTDAPLLFCWALAFHTLLRLTERPSLGLGALLGAAIGVGLLSKYAMIYFVLCMAVAAFFRDDVRKLLRTKWMAVALAVASACVAPNLLWNATRDFATFAHTASNANLGGSLVNLNKLLEFLASQLGVFGPILFLALLIGAERFTRTEATDGRGDARALLLSFSLPVLAAASFIALVSRANANWAAPAFVAATPLVVFWLRKPKWQGLFLASLVLHGAVALFVPTVMAMPGIADRLGRSNDLKRVRGWSEIGAGVAARANDDAYTAILAEEREVMGELLFYARPRSIPVVMWDWERRPRNHYELAMRIDGASGRKVLLVSRIDNPSYILSRFERSTPLGAITVTLDAKRKRTVYLFALEGFKPRLEEPDDTDN